MSQSGKTSEPLTCNSGGRGKENWSSRATVLSVRSEEKARKSMQEELVKQNSRVLTFNLAAARRSPLPIRTYKLVSCRFGASQRPAQEMKSAFSFCDFSRLSCAFQSISIGKSATT